jgi:ATP-dependent DNA helicase RecG
MSQRPEILFPLFGDIRQLNGIGPKLAQLLMNADLRVPKDFLLHLPGGIIDRRLRETIKDLPPPVTATAQVVVGMHKPNERKGRPYRVFVQDAEVEFQLVFFNARKDWLQKTLPHGQRRIVSGRIEMFDGLLQMVHPDYVLTQDEADTLPPYEPIYPLTAGITQKVMRKAVTGALALAPELEEWIDPHLIADKNWPNWHDAIEAAHAPTSEFDTSPKAAARERLAYDELLSHQATLALARETSRKKRGRATTGTGALHKKVLEALPFDPTRAQLRATEEIKADMADQERMNRLLQGDVGSGKTLVAFLAALAAIEAGGQAAIMAPTEILARQHIQGLRDWAKTAGITLDILTGRDTGGARASKLEALANGETQLIVGTHALFQDDVEMLDLRLAVIDEQHRFGVHQRMRLGQKGQGTDILVMTATPIPRSLELSNYGDMDVSVLDEKPGGRKPIETVLISAQKIDAVIDRMQGAIAQGRQAYWVCPLVHASEVMEATAAEERFKELRARLGDAAVGLVHGQMPPAQKDAAMADFVAGTTKLLVATTVIEVGVDVPNATIMVIEGAQKFGLSQLHQLRGRVGRGAQASSCLLMYDSPLGETAMARLKIMRQTNDGFAIAEEDLRIRGAGDVLGAAQSGLPRFKIADPETQTDLMHIAQTDARSLLASDPKLTSKRGQAMRVLLHLMEREKSYSMISVG